MLPFRSFYGFENWLDHSGYLQEPSSLIKPMESDAGKSMLSTATKMEKKSKDACKSHREAERRRRQRINAHLSTLRSLLPNAAKLDKASLLAEVVQRVKELRKQASDVARRHDGDLSCSSSSAETGSDHSESEAWPFPGESDEATVINYCDSVGQLKLMKATLCCEDRPNLNRDLNQAIRSVRAKVIRAETMTVGGRTKSVVVMEWPCGEEEEVGALERALKAVMENRALVGSGLGRMVLGDKRVRDCHVSDVEGDSEVVLGTAS